MAEQNVISSESDIHFSCGTDDLNQHLLQTIPGWKSCRQFVEKFSQAARISEEKEFPLVWIPVVVHIVYNTPAQNLSQQQIESQIAVLNADFTATNADIENVPNVFKPLIGNPQIRFFLAKRDPTGAQTNGVTRTQTNTVSFPRRNGQINQDMKFTAHGGADAWPSDRYLNIWSCHLSDLLGYAQFPATLVPETDGVVIQWDAFGRGGSARAPFNLGRTTTHEIGHWLDLRHISGDDRLGCSGSDLVDDTPNQAGQNEGVPTFPHITCGNGPNGDLFMNYMDYPNDSVTIMFTNGQVARMRAALNGPRSSIIGSTYQQFILQTGTALHETDETFQFIMTDWNGDGRPDLVAIKKSKTGTNSTEIHVLSGASNFRQFILQTGTALHETDASFVFLMAPRTGNKNPDLIAIKKSVTSSNSTEIHILAGEKSYKSFKVQTATILPATDDTFQFTSTDWNSDGHTDIVAIKKTKTGSKSTEVHILSGASGYKNWLLQTGTALEETSDEYEFLMADFNGDGRPDLIAVQKTDSRAKFSKVRILSGASNFKNWLVQTETAIHKTDKNFQFLVTDWDGTGRPDLVAIKKRFTGTGSTEVHIIAG